MIGRVRNVLSRHGWAGTARLVVRSVAASLAALGPAQRRRRAALHAFDRRYGVDTAAIVPASALGFGASYATAAVHAAAYQTITVEAFDRALDAVPAECSHCTFVDIGCGKGRAVLLASRRPFRRVIGVELSPRLVWTAAKNVARFRDPQQRCTDVEIVCTDASRYELPGAGDVLVYLYNPFGEPVMRVFAETLRSAVAVPGRRVWVLYLNPLHRAVLDGCDFLESIPDAAGYCVYRGAG